MAQCFCQFNRHVCERENTVMAKKAKRSKATPKRRGASVGVLGGFSVETVVSAFVLLAAILVVLSPYIFNMWMTPTTQKHVSQAVSRTAFERAPANAND